MISLAAHDRTVYSDAYSLAPQDSSPFARLPHTYPRQFSPLFSSSEYRRARKVVADDGAEGALGTDRKLQAVSHTERRRLSWARWRLASELLPDERIKDCRQYASFTRLLEGKAPSIVKSSEGYRLAGVCRCKSIWGCPLCSGTETQQRRDALESSVDFWRSPSDEYPEGRGFLLITYTIAHTRQDELAQLVERFGRAQVKMAESRAYKQLMKRYGVQHHVRSFEVTVGEDTGWHPHRHDLAFSLRRLTEDEAMALWHALTHQWIMACAAVGLVTTPEEIEHMLEISVNIMIGYGDVGEYLEKHGEQPRWSLAAEVAKGASKAGRVRRNKRGTPRFTPFQLLDAIGDPSCSVKPSRLRSWFQEYYKAFKRCHQLHWSDGAKAALCYEEPSPEDEDKSPQLVEFTWPEWIATRRAGAQCALLEACDERGYLGFLDTVTALVEAQLLLVDGQLRYEGFKGRIVTCDVDRRYRFVEVCDEHKAAAVPDWVTQPPELVDPDPDLTHMFSDLPEWVF